MTISEKLRELADEIDRDWGNDQQRMKAYELQQPIPGLPSGTIFILDKNDHVKGSIGYGCLKNAWCGGDCQAGWCAGTHVFPGQLSSDRQWFKRVKNSGKYHL